MAESDIVSTVLHLADQDGNLSEDSRLFILAAFDGDHDLADASSAAGPQERQRPTGGSAPDLEPVGAYLSAIEVEGFRGVGSAATLNLKPGPGLTIVAGRNGSGKSSFAEAAEFALTGKSYRWQNKAAVWREGWRNLHHEGATSIRVRIAEEGSGPTTVGVDVDGGKDLDDAAVWVQRDGAKRQAGRSCLGWEHDIETFRPFLPYDELGGILERRPSELYDAVEAILGLGQLEDAEHRLAERRKLLETPVNNEKGLRKDLRAACATVPDERATRAGRLLGKRTPDVAGVRDLAVGAGQPESGGVLAALQAIVGLRLPAREAIESACCELIDAASQLTSLRESARARDAELRAIMRTALDLHARHGDIDCPVCGEGRLDAGWATRVSDVLASDDEDVSRLSRATTDRNRARGQLEHVVGGLPPALRSAAHLDVNGLSQLRVEWAEWCALPDDDVAAANKAAQYFGVVEELVSAVRLVAEEELKRRDDAWSPLALRLAAWVRLADEVEHTATIRADVIAAHQWIREHRGMLRDERLRPLSEQAAKVWAELRQESNVDLGPIELEGSNTRRRLSLEASVDGTSAGALPVMSQGELHALALALFIPRATMPASPFQFVIIDDPVQAMDPAKVDGLARVLSDLAATRQVIVFTHDDRLPETARRLGIGCHIVEVHRGARSVVDVVPSREPSGRYLDDARAVASDFEVPDATRVRVIPELCRMAVESACREVYFGRNLLAGRGRGDIEDQWSQSPKTRQRVALALDRDNRELDAWLERDRRRPRALTACGRAAHEGLIRDPHGAIDDVRLLIDAIMRSGS